MTQPDANGVSPTPQQAGVAPGPVAIPDPGDAAMAAAFDQYTQQELQKQNRALQAHIAAAAEKDPNITAEAQRLGLQTGVGADIASRNMAIVRKMALVNDAGAQNLPQTAPRLAQLLQDPSFSGVAYDDLDSLGRIEQNAAVMRAPTLAERAMDYEYPLNRALMQFPLTRAVTNLAGGATEMAGDIGSFFGWHGNGPTRENWLQRQAENLTPQRYGVQPNQFDAVVRNVGPVLAAMPLSMGTSLVARTLGLSENASKVLTALVVGSGFTASQGGQTFTDTAASGRSDAEARHDADLVAAINAPLNVGMGLTELVPGLRDYPLLSALGVGGATGAVGRLAQNRVTGQPWSTGLGESAIEGAAVQGGMHLGFALPEMVGDWRSQGQISRAAEQLRVTSPDAFWQRMGDITDAVAASKLRTRQPEAFARFMDATFEGDPSVRIPAQEFVDHFAKTNRDPAEMANRVGVSNLDEAAAAGADLAIPRANFFAKLDPEDQKALAANVVDPSTELTARQAEAGRAELAEFVSSGRAEQLAAEFQQADEETQASPGWQKVFNDLKQRYVDAGETDAVADKYATLQANALSHFASNTGKTPEEVLKLHNPQVVAGTEAPGVSEEDAEHAAVLRQGGNFGPVHDEFYHDAQGAIAKLLEEKDGEATAALHHPELGDIDLVYGKEGSSSRNYKDGFGLAKIAIKHPGILDNLQGNIESMPILSRSKNRAILGDGEGRAIVSLEHFGREKRWLLTAYREDSDAVSAAKGGTIGVTDHAEPEPNPSGQEADKADTSVPQSGSFKGPLYQDGLDQRKQRNLEMARVQGEILKGAEPAEAAPEGTRGWFRVLPNGAVEIGKTKLGDLSTFIHEPAHAYLELFRQMTQRGEASEALKDDFRKITDWLGTTPEEVYKNGFTREQHEQWALANEQYAREGKAPTSALGRVFHGFSVWLQRIYRQASVLGVEMSDDIRGVMDRLYAGEDAVGRAERENPRQPLAETPEDAKDLGWTEDEYKNYAEAHDLAVDDAKSAVMREMNEAAQREQSEERREETRNVRDAVTEQIDASPEYTAIRSLRRGAMDDGSPLTLNKDALVNQFGEARVKALNQLHRGLYRNEGGTDAETAAELMGFGSGEEMLRAIENAPRRSAAIEAATRDYLVNKYGDVRYDGTLNDRARFNLENNERGANIYRELKALRAKVASLEKKSADAKAAMAAITIEPLEHYQEAAHAMIQQKAPADLQPHRYLDASRRFSREAFDALRKGNVRKAAEAKNKELLNHFLFREAAPARDYVDKFEKYARRVQGVGIQQRLGLADQNAKQAGGTGDYRDQFNWLLARYKLGPMVQAPERSLREWADEMQGMGNDTAIAPGLLNETRCVDYRGVPISEIRELHQGLVNIRHLAQREFQMYVQGKQVRFAEARPALVNAARENLKVKPETVFEENRSRAQKLSGPLQYVDARLTPMERWIEWLDGGKTGPWHDNVWNLSVDAQGDEDTLQHEIAKTITDALAEMPDQMRRRLWTEKVSVDGISEPLTRRRLLSMAFNMGNEGNLDRLRKTFAYFGWDRAAIQRIGGMLTREEWQFVQKAWDWLKPLGQRANEMQQRLTGLPLEMVKVTPFKVALDDGTEMSLGGGYFPIVMDPKHSQRAIEQDSRESAQNAMQSGYVRATTSKGYTKARTGFGGPLLLDYERALTSHVAKVTKDLSHREFMLSTQRLLLDTEVRKALRETLGPEYEKQFMPWLRTIINDNNGSVQEGLDTLKDGMQKLRSNFVAGALGFNPSTVLLQISHAPRMVLYAKPASLVQSLVDFLAHPMESTHEVKQLSPNEMRFRGDNLDRDLRAVLQNPSYRGGYARKVAVAARFALATVDHLLSHTLWRAAFRDAMAKYPNLAPEEAQKRAVHEADSAVRLGLGAHAPKDLPAIMRNNEFNKFITTLYGFHNGVYSQLRDIGHQFRYDRNVGKLTLATILTATLPTVLGSMLTGHGPKDGENPGWWAGKRSLLFAADTVPMLRAAASFMDGGSDVQFSPIESVMQKGAKTAMEAMEATSDKDDKDWPGIGLNAADAVGEALGVPGIHAATRTLRYVHRANEGRIENPNAWNAIVGGGR